MKLRFAEHMLLESSNYQLKPYLRHHDDGTRCALGLVERPGACAEKLYPWVCEPISAMPCTCAVDKDVLTRATAAIAHLFNNHVSKGVESKYGVGGYKFPDAEPWTMDRLAQWIDSVDPTPRLVEPQEEQSDGRQVPIPTASLEVTAV